VIKPTVWIQAGIVVIYGSSLDASQHHHHAIQIIWPQMGSLCKLNGNDISELFIVNSEIEHQLQMSAGWILLIEPKSNLGEELSIKLAGHPFKKISSSFSAPIKPPTQINEISTLLSPMLIALKVKHHLSLTNKIIVKDKRIQQLLTELDHCLQGDCIKPSSWRAREVASQLALSESRFLHLFSNELGISWRPYLLWRRMICAIQAMINQNSATNAAHLAGFSDSAHLSRTFRKTFGMTIKQAHILFRK